MTLRKFKEEEQVALGPVSKETKYEIWVLYSQDPRFYDDFGGHEWQTQSVAIASM